MSRGHVLCLSCKVSLPGTRSAHGDYRCACGNIHMYWYGSMGNQNRDQWRYRRGQYGTLAYPRVCLLRPFDVELVSEYGVRSSVPDLQSFQVDLKHGSVYNPGVYNPMTLHYPEDCTRPTVVGK